MNRTHLTATAQRRQRQIEDCLLENLHHTPYISFSVSDLCRQIDISRKAFYNYYADKDTCFSAIMDRYVRESLFQLSQLPDNSTPLEGACVLLEYWKEKKALFDILMRDNLLHFLYMANIRCIQYDEPDILALLNHEYVPVDQDILACYTSTQMTLVIQWYFRGFDTPVEEMAKKLLRLLYAPMLPFPGEK